MDVRALNSAVPHPDPRCPKCGGAGAYYDPPKAAQEEQLRRGDRAFTSRRMCDCYSAGNPKPMQWVPKVA